MTAGAAGRIADHPGRRKGCYFPVAARMRSSHSNVKQFSAAFQWIERSHLRITLRSASYITFKAASSLGKATRGFRALRRLMFSDSTVLVV